MSTASGRWPGGTWAILLSIFLCLDLATCQEGGTYRLTSTPASFLGFDNSNPTSVVPFNCKTTALLVTSSTFGGCCAATNCQMFTACNNGVLTRSNGTHATCAASIPNCWFQTIYPSSPIFASTSWIRIACASEGYGYSTLYREIVPSQTATITQILTADGATITVERSTSSKSPSTSSPTNTGPDPSPKQGPEAAEPGADPDQGANRPQETGTLPSSPPPAASAAATEAPSKAWIAGAVVGPLVALAALGILVFWLGKRLGERKGGTGGRAELQQQPGADTPPLYDPGPEKHEMPVYYQGPGEHPPQRYSLPPPVHELAPAEMPPQELAGR